MKFHLVRKSKWLLLLIILKIIIITLFLLLVLLFFYHLIKHFWKEISIPLIIIAYFLVFWGYFSSIISLTRYFFDILLITDKTIYKFKIGLFFSEDISMVEIYRIQEIKAFTNWFLRVLFNVGELHLVEQKDKEKIIHNIDNPEKIAKIIENIKVELVQKRRA